MAKMSWKNVAEHWKALAVGSALGDAEGKKMAQERILSRITVEGAGIAPPITDEDVKAVRAALAGHVEISVTV